MMSHEARELVLYADNTSSLYHQSYKPIIENLRKKVRKGAYNPALAVKLWCYHADRAAKEYAREHGTPGVPWHRMFPTSARREAAQHWESETRTAHPNDDAFIGLVQHDASRSRARRRPAARRRRASRRRR